MKGDAGESLQVRTEGEVLMVEEGEVVKVEERRSCCYCC